MKKYEFMTKKRESKWATGVASLYLTVMGALVLNQEENPQFQTRDIDLEVVLTGGKKILVEVKGDNYRSPNMFFETVSNCDKGTEGCFLTSEADVWFYYFRKTDVGYWMPMKEVREWFLENLDDFPARPTSTGSGNGGYRSEGRLVPIERLLAEVPTVKEHKGVFARIARWHNVQCNN